MVSPALAAMSLKTGTGGNAASDALAAFPALFLPDGCVLACGASFHCGPLGGLLQTAAKQMQVITRAKTSAPTRPMKAL